MSDLDNNQSSRWKRGKNAFFSLFERRAAGKKPAINLATKQVLSVKQIKLVPSRSQWRHLPKLLSKNEQRLAIAGVFLVLAAGSLLSVRLVNTQRSEIPAVGGEYTEGLIGTPQLINPLYSATSDVDTDLTRLIYSGLMRYDSDHGLVPDLAESFTVSSDQTVYTFVLRDDVKWHDGKPLVPGDVVFTINAIQTPEYRSPLQVSFAGVQVQQIDDHTVRFTLSEPFAPFLSLLTVGILPSHLWGNVSAINAPLSELNKKPIGTGPYEFEKLVKDSKGSIRSYTLTRNANFYRGSPYIETLHFKFYSDAKTAIDALKNSNVEGLSFVPTEKIESLKSESRLQLVYPALSQYTAAFINLNRDLLSDVHVREALLQATNKQAIVDDVLDGYGRTTDSFILDGMLGASDDLAVLSYDIEAARTKLNDAGWTLEDGASVRQKDGTPLTIQLVTLSSEELTQTANALKSQWAAVGANVEIQVVDTATLQSDILKNRSYDILLSGEQYGIDPDPYAFWHSSQATYPGLNLSGFSNRNADGYIETGRSTSDREKRAEAYSELQKIVNDTTPAIFLYQPSYTYAVAKRIQGIDIPQIVIPADRFSQIETWYIKTRRVLKKKSADSESQTSDLKEQLETIDAQTTTTPETTDSTTDSTADTTTTETTETTDTVDNSGQ